MTQHSSTLLMHITVYAMCSCSCLTLALTSSNRVYGRSCHESQSLSGSAYTHVTVSVEGGAVTS